MSIQTNNLPDNPQIEVVKSGKTGLFTNYIFKAIPLAFDESLSYYECLCGLLNYLKNTIIPSVNNNADAVAELQNLYIELKTYVDDYFTNLDVQEEINNKLDDMVEQGTLQEIIADYLNSKAIFGFDNVSSMKSSTNLINGSYAKTLGYYSKNDGGGALYKIRNITNDDVIDEMFIIEMNDPQNQLIAELIYDSEINILKLGGKKDNTTDISSIISACINKTNITNILIPYGNYNISNSIIIKSELTIKGENSILNFTGSGSLFNTPVSGSTIHLNIEKLNINGNETNNGFNLTNLYDSKINNLKLYNIYDGFTISSSWDNLIENVRIQSSYHKPLILGSQCNNTKFLNCYIISQNYPITLNNCEGILFDTCDISNNENENAIYIFQSLVKFVNCYFENLNPNKTIIVPITENIPSTISIDNCLSSSSGFTVIPAKAYLTFNNMFRGSFKIGTRNLYSDVKPACDISLSNLSMPENYYASKQNATYYFDGKANPNFATIGSDPDKSVVFEDGELKVTFPNNNSTTNGGLAFADLTVDKDYLLIIEGETPDNDNLIFYQYGDTFSTALKINEHNNKLIIPFKASTTSLYIRWLFTGTFKIRKLIIQESKKYI